MLDIARIKKEFKKVTKVLETVKPVDPHFQIPSEEFIQRQQKVYSALQSAGLEVGIVFSDQHYSGDVPYLGGNTNVTIAQVAGVIGKTGFHLIAGPEGGYIAEQLAHRANARVHRVEILRLEDEEYPANVERLEDVIEEAAGGKVDKIGLLTPRQVISCALTKYISELYGRENVIDLQDLYCQIKYEKSDNEMRLIRDSCVIGDAMMRSMLAVLKPDMLETEVAAWAYLVAKELGSEEMGWDVMVGANEANRTLIGKALNRPINRSDYVHLGVAPKRDGLNSSIRRSVIAVKKPSQVKKEQRYWFDLVEGAYNTGYEKFVEVAQKDLPARLQEQALIDYFREKSPEVSRKIKKKIDLERLKPYTGTHNAGYTECQEFFGAITLNSHEKLGNQIVMMLDVALRGIGDRWDDVIIPGFDFVVVENTLGKFGNRVETLNKVPLNVQELVGQGV